MHHHIGQLKHPLRLLLMLLVLRSHLLPILMINLVPLLRVILDRLIILYLLQAYQPIKEQVVDIINQEIAKLYKEPRPLLPKQHKLISIVLIRPYIFHDPGCIEPVGKLLIIGGPLTIYIHCYKRLHQMLLQGIISEKYILIKIILPVSLRVMLLSFIFMDWWSQKGDKVHHFHSDMRVPNVFIQDDSHCG